MSDRLEEVTFDATGWPVNRGWPVLACWMSGQWDQAGRNVKVPQHPCTHTESHFAFDGSVPACNEHDTHPGDLLVALLAGDLAAVYHGPRRDGFVVEWTIRTLAAQGHPVASEVAAAG